MSDDIPSDWFLGVTLEDASVHLRHHLIRYYYRNTELKTSSILLFYTNTSKWCK